MEQSHRLCAARFSVLALLNEAELIALNNAASEMEVASNVAVISEGIQNASLYFVLSGMLVVSKRHDGHIVEVATNAAGHFFGETSILNNAPTSAELRTITDTCLLLVPDTVILDIMAHNEKFKRALIQTSMRRAACTALAVNHIFKVLPKSVRETLLHNAEMVELAANQFILTEGENDTDEVYLLVSGQCEAFVSNPLISQRRVVIANLVAGDEFGEVPLITYGGHVASVHTKSRCVLLKIPVELIRNWMHRYREFDLAVEQCVKYKLKHSEKVVGQAVSVFQEEISGELDALT